MMSAQLNSVSDNEALIYHAEIRPGKIEIIASKPMATRRDLSLAYSPGVAAPVLAIAANPAAAFEYTAKANLVAVVSNGTAILGLGNLGALASKPVMEGKAILFKRFADVDAIDLELDSEDPEEIINAVALLEPTFGGINLEDIKAPECFVIEQGLKARMKIPVFHDDQHGTAIIAIAGLINALHLTGRDHAEAKLVINGAGAAALSCAELAKAVGVKNVVLCDSKGVVYRGRAEGMNQWKLVHAVETTDRTLSDAIRGADVFFGLSVQGAMSQDMVRSMNPRPIIFAMANPNPEILPDQVKEVRTDAIIATGRSDFPNQVNNVLCFPFIFRGALDVHATEINMEMKLAAADAIAMLARELMPQSISTATNEGAASFGPENIIPSPFDRRLIEIVSLAVARAAISSGVARKPIADEERYRLELRARLDRIYAMM
jgi:malate dehydrogenase (oxaloacetate-decarboxylating)(NADP+)